jgi:hypothetical protein
MSTPISAIVAKITEDLGPLVANHQEYESLYKAIRSGEHAHDIVPSVLPRMIRQESWMNRYDRNTGKAYTYQDAREFVRFIEDKPPQGLGTTADQLRRYLALGSPERIAFEAAIDRGRGGLNNPTHVTQPRTNNGTYTVNPNTVRVDGSDALPETIPISDPPQKRDRLREPQAGNAVGYAVRRLGRERPDLLDRVKTGAITPNAAMIEAGFRHRTISVPIEPQLATQIIVRHFKDESLLDLIHRLANWAGGQFIEPESIDQS